MSDAAYKNVQKLYICHRYLKIVKYFKGFIRVRGGRAT
jgi:hypothetical protein